jgi:hypothetical protein
MSMPEDSRTLPALVYIADRLAAEAEQGFRIDLTNLACDPAVLDTLKLPQAKVDELKASLPDQIIEVQAILTGT